MFSVVKFILNQFVDGIIISASTTAHEIFDILFRVQGSKLAETDRPRNLIGGLVGELLVYQLYCLAYNYMI